MSQTVAAETEPTAAETQKPALLLESLEIKGYRCFEHLVIEKLGRVNLIVGSNGVGKTSLLEAIEFAYCGRTRRAGVVSVDTSVTAEMEGTAEKLSSTTSAVRLRARHSNWYAKTEIGRAHV